MKNEQKQQARALYFQSNLTKTEIAERLGINRRTVMLWCQEGNWERLRRSAQHMPALVAEKCYFILDQYANRFLDGINIASFSEKHADAINKLASTIKKLKNRSTVNESMEMFNYFMERLGRQDPVLASEVLPHIESYISSRKDLNTSDFLPEDFDPDGSLPYNNRKVEDQWQDEKDAEAFKKELQDTNNDYDLALQNWQNPNPGDSGIPVPPPTDPIPTEPPPSLTPINPPTDPTPSPQPTLDPVPA